MIRKLFTSAIFLSVLFTGARAQSVIQLIPESNGRYTMDAKVNGVGVKTYYSEENWFASMSSTTYLFLYENGYIADEDVKGMTVVKMPDGSTVKSGFFVIRNLKIGKVIVKDLPAFVIKKQNVPLIVGNSAFDCFGEVVVKDDELLIYDGIDRGGDIVMEGVGADTEEGLRISFQDSLRQAAQMHIDAKEYKAAATCLGALREKEGLEMYNEYQYIVILNILERNEEVIDISGKWLDAYAGKTSLLDFWIHDAAGDSYSRIGKHQESIEAYEKAVSAYYAIFNTSEKELLKSRFQDNTLGVTMFDLARQYAANGNLMKSKHCYFISAKCGNEAAVEVCKKYNIKR